MNESDFKKYANNTRMDGAALEGARLVLVSGLGVREAGRKLNISAAAISNAIKRIKREAMEIVGCPDNWVCGTYCIPKTVAKKFLEIEMREKKKAGLVV